MIRFHRRIVPLFLCLALLFGAGFSVLASHPTASPHVLFPVPLTLNGLNMPRSLNQLIAYTNDYSARNTETDDKGFEVLVSSAGLVTALGGNNNVIPAGGFVLSGSGVMRDFLQNQLRIGDRVHLDEEAKVVLIVQADFSPFHTASLLYSQRNMPRGNQITLYESGYSRAVNDTDGSGWEVAVDSKGCVIAVGEDGLEVPENGYVVSAPAEKAALLASTIYLGMSVERIRGKNELLFFFDRANARKYAELTVADCKNRLEDAKEQFRSVDLLAAAALLAELGNQELAIGKAVYESDMFALAVGFYRLQTLSSQFPVLLTENPAVETRAITVLPLQNTLEQVKSRVAELYALGFNTVFIEGLFNNTVITPMPGDSLFTQNPYYQGFDVLGAYVDECHKYGLELHLRLPAFLVADSLSEHPALDITALRPDWRLISADGLDHEPISDGQKRHWINPASPDARDYLLTVYQSILSRYAVDGFQLYALCYPSEKYGYDPATRQLFAAEKGVDPAELAEGDPLIEDWKAFRAGFATSFLKESADLTEKIRPDIVFSCELSPKNQLQNTREWVRKGYADLFVLPITHDNTNPDPYGDFATSRSLILFSPIDCGLEQLENRLPALRALGAQGLVLSLKTDAAAHSLPGQRALSPTFNAQKALTAQLHVFRSRLQTLVLPLLEDNRSLKDLVVQTGILTQAVTQSGVSPRRADLDAFFLQARDLILTHVSLPHARTKLLGDLAFAEKIVSLSRDDEKEIYYQKNPLPDLYDLSNNDPSSQTGQINVKPPKHFWQREEGLYAAAFVLVAVFCGVTLVIRRVKRKKIKRNEE